MKGSAFWNITPFSQFKVNLRFGGICRLLLQGRRISQTTNRRESRWQADGLPTRFMFMLTDKLMVTQMINKYQPLTELGCLALLDSLKTRYNYQKGKAICYLS
jgi:hypothetical protein